MKAAANPSNESHQRKANANRVAQRPSSQTASFEPPEAETFAFEDRRPEAVAQRKLQALADSSPQVRQLRAIQGMANNSPQAKQAAQLQSMAHKAAQQQSLIQKKENNSGLPDDLKSGIENLSAYSMDDVKVHYHSNKPAQLQAHAYAQGTDIHLGPGQEKHLPHEAWHVVQQMQGRVRPMMQAKGVSMNDDPALEREADLMGEKAATPKSPNRFPALQGKSVTNEGGLKSLSVGVVQRARAGKFDGSSYQKHDKKTEVIYALTDSENKVFYVGKSNDAARRKKEHDKDPSKPQVNKIVPHSTGSWTTFETATFEQFWYGYYGGYASLVNKQNPLDYDKWLWFSDTKYSGHNDNQCTKLTKKHFD